MSAVQFTVDLPFPPAELSPNRKNGRHWSATNAIKSRYLSDCRHLAIQAMTFAAFVPTAGDVSLSITFVQPDKRRRDRDNLLAAAKSGLDGLAMAFGCDDADFNPIIIRRAFGSKPGAMRIEVMAGGLA